MNIAAPPFKLYPEERHWWSMSDYGAVLGVMRELQPKRVLEFGPGSSTLALIEGGATSIDTCEDNEDWARVYDERLVGRFPEIVRLHRYVWGDPIYVHGVDGQRFDLALIDGPLGTPQRPPVVRYCLERCDAVLVPTEDLNPSFRQSLKAIARETGWRIEIWETGPLSGGFALMTPEPPVVADESADEAPASVPPAEIESREDDLAIEAPAAAPSLSRRARRRKARAERTEPGA